jgi:hypothetical protein
MKRFIILLLLSIQAMAQGTLEDPFHVNYDMVLRWPEPQTIELVVKHTIYAEQVPSPDVTNPFLTKVEKQVEGVSLLELLGTAPNGVYKLYITFTNTRGIESTPSPFVWVFWHYRPNPPGKPWIEVLPIQQ